MLPSEFMATRKLCKGAYYCKDGQTVDDEKDSNECIHRFKTKRSAKAFVDAWNRTPGNATTYENLPVIEKAEPKPR